MRQGLIIGARPRFTKGKPFPRVPLGVGGWRIEAENHVTTKIRLTIHKPTPVDNGTAHIPSVAEIPSAPNHILVEGPAYVSAEIIEAGSESYVSVYAYRMR